MYRLQRAVVQAGERDAGFRVDTVGAHALRYCVTDGLGQILTGGNVAGLDAAGDAVDQSLVGVGVLQSLAHGEVDRVALARQVLDHGVFTALASALDLDLLRDAQDRVQCLLVAGGNLRGPGLCPEMTRIPFTELFPGAQALGLGAHFGSSGAVGANGVEVVHQGVHELCGLQRALHHGIDGLQLLPVDLLALGQPLLQVAKRIDDIGYRLGATNRLAHRFRYALVCGDNLRHRLHSPCGITRRLDCLAIHASAQPGQRIAACVV